MSRMGIGAYSFFQGATENKLAILQNVMKKLCNEQLVESLIMDPHSTTSFLSFL